MGGSSMASSTKREHSSATASTSPSSSTEGQKVKLVRRLKRDPRFLAEWTREKLVEHMVELAEIISDSELGGVNAPSMKVQAMKEFNDRVEILLEVAEEHGDVKERASTREQELAPATHSSKVGSRAPWVAPADGMAEEDPVSLGGPPVELSDRPE